jgi:hypothetical protein
MPETTEDAAAWYTLTGLLKTCTEFIHKAIESSPIIISSPASIQSTLTSPHS